MRGWLSGAFAAARVASERADLWLPVSLAPFAAAGWLVLLLTVTPLPSAADAAAIGLQIQAPPFEEEKMLRVARMYEAATDWHTRRARVA